MNFPLGMVPEFLRPKKLSAAQDEAAKLEDQVKQMHNKMQHLKLDIEDLRKAISEGKTNIKVGHKWVRLPRWSNHTGAPCGAITRYPGAPPCRNLSMSNGKCRMHGGKTPRNHSRRKNPDAVQQEPLQPS
jgi:hypothetical protein